MALVKTDLVLMGDGRAYKDYRYESTSDTLATIEADAYFDSLADMFRTNDLIEAWGTDGYRKYKVTRSASDIALSVVDFENAVTTATTSGNLPNFGTVIVPAASTAAAYTIDDPIAGLEVTLVQDNTTTTGFTVTANTTPRGSAVARRSKPPPTPVGFRTCWRKASGLGEYKNFTSADFAIPPVFHS